MSGVAGAQHDVSSVSPVIRRTIGQVSAQPNPSHEDSSGQDLNGEDSTWTVQEERLSPEPEKPHQSQDQLIPFLLDFHNNNNLSVEGLIKYI